MIVTPRRVVVTLLVAMTLTACTASETPEAPPGSVEALTNRLQADDAAARDADIAAAQERSDARADAAVTRLDAATAQRTERRAAER